jgi:hypothetical protein
MNRPVTLAFCAFLAALALSRGASAQARKSKPRLVRTTGGTKAIDSARAMAKAGDCKGALAAFDEAEDKGTDATVLRDRGRCHEKLGDVFPAIDDYRAYLMLRPEANDADDIRSSLASLEGMTAPVKANETGSAPRSASASKDGAEPLTFRSYDSAMQEKQQREFAEGSGLRRGRGFILAPYLGLRRALGSSATSDLGYQFGLSGRYAFGSVGTFVVELGMAGFGKAGSVSSVSGLQTMVGLEGRFALDPLASNQIFILGGLGYERLKNTASKRTDSLIFLPRLKLGYRHVFGPSLGLEIAIDGGPFIASSSNLPLGQVASSGVQGMLGGTLSMAVAF